MEVKEIIRNLSMLNPDMKVKEAIQFYHDLNLLNTGKVKK